MRYSVAFLVLLLFLAGIAWVFTTNPAFLSDSSSLRNTLKLQSVEFRPGVSVIVEVADTKEARTYGLSGRTSLQENRGLLMVFEEDTYPEIWMKDMKFPIDIIWISAQGEIVTIAPSVRPESYPEVFRPKQAARYVLEVPALYTEIHSIYEGDIVTIKR